MSQGYSDAWVMGSFMRMAWMSQLDEATHTDPSPRWHLYPVELMEPADAPIWLHAGRAVLDIT